MPLFFTHHRRQPAVAPPPGALRGAGTARGSAPSTRRACLVDSSHRAAPWLSITDIATRVTGQGTGARRARSKHPRQNPSASAWCSAHIECASSGRRSRSTVWRRSGVRSELTGATGTAVFTGPPRSLSLPGDTPSRTRRFGTTRHRCQLPGSRTDRRDAAPMSGAPRPRGGGHCLPTSPDVAALRPHARRQSWMDPFAT